MNKKIKESGAQIVRFTQGNIKGRIARVLGHSWCRRFHDVWKGPSETAMTFVDLVPSNKNKNTVVLKCTPKCVVEHIENQVVLTKLHFVSINFPINMR